MTVTCFDLISQDISFDDKKDQPLITTTDCAERISADNGSSMSKQRIRRPLTDAERDDAERLKSIYQRRKRELAAQGTRLTQEDLAARCGWSGQSAVAQYVSGKTPLNLNAALKFAKELDVELVDISPRLAQSHGLIIKRSAGGTAGVDRNDELIIVTDAGDRLGRDKVELPVFMEVETSAGDGTTQVVESDKESLSFSARVLQRCGVSAEDAAVAIINGNSMMPVLADGTIVGIDKADTTISDGKLYAVDHGGLLRVKILHRLPGGGIMVSSFNRSEHPEERYDAGWTGSITVLGRVFWSATEW